MCGHQKHRQPSTEDLHVSDRERQSVVDALGRHWAAGEMDVEEYEGRVGQAVAASGRDQLRAALGDAETIEPLLRTPGGRRGSVLRTPIGIAAALLAAVAVVAIVAAVTPLAFGFHPAFFWIVPLVGFKVAKFHGRSGFGRPRPAERTISV